MPQLSDSTEPAQWRTLSPEGTQEMLRANCFTPHDEFWRQPWLVRRTTSNSELYERREQLVRQLSAQVPCFEVRFGIRNPLDSLVEAVHEVVRQS